MSLLTLDSAHQCFGGTVSFYRHESVTCNGPMKFSVYAPPQMTDRNVPVVYFLSGLTCTEENFMAKSGAQRCAAELGLCLVVPDTSPRNTGIPDEDADWVYGTGASFYIDAIEAPWSRHYQMYRYVVEELPTLIEQNFSVCPGRQGIMGHSMGGHGALVIGLRNRDRFHSISALAPIANPTQSDWSLQAFRLYLGENPDLWHQYDATALLAKYHDDRPLLVDQGLSDQFIEALGLDAFESAAKTAGRSLTLRRHPGYDHGYYFIASFIDDHLRHHAQILYAL